MEDIITIVNGRPELVDEIANVSAAAREFVNTEISTYLGEPAFLNSIACHLNPDAYSQARLPVIKDRLIQLADL